MKGFLEKFGASYKVLESEKWVVSHELEYCGTMDADAMFLGNRIIQDYKTASSYGQDKKDQYFEQMAGYDIANGSLATEYHIIPLNPKNKCGFGAPIITKDVTKYREAFLVKLAEFNKTFRNQAK